MYVWLMYRVQSRVKIHDIVHLLFNVSNSTGNFLTDKIRLYVFLFPFLSKLFISVHENQVPSVADCFKLQTPNKLGSLSVTTVTTVIITALPEVSA